MNYRLYNELLNAEKKATERAKKFTKNLIDVLSMNGKKISEKDANEVYKNVFYAELVANDK